ncbi:hypothetical protein Tco_0964138 [Tanacetum coccineum]
MYSSIVPLTSYLFYTKPSNPLPNASIYPTYGLTGLIADLTGCVTPFVRWIEDYHLSDGLKIPSHVGSYDGKGDPNNYLCDNHYLSRLNNQSIERDRLIGIGFVLDFVKFISSLLVTRK